jgi:hypothetical protein
MKTHHKDCPSHPDSTHYHQPCSCKDKSEKPINHLTTLITEREATFFNTNFNKLGGLCFKSCDYQKMFNEIAEERRQTISLLLATLQQEVERKKEFAGDGGYKQALSDICSLIKEVKGELQ